jgi:hypothetical protein
VVPAFSVGNGFAVADQKNRMAGFRQDSLRWHYPDRFDGYDLSPPDSEHPGGKTMSRSRAGVNPVPIAGILPCYNNPLADYA